MIDHRYRYRYAPRHRNPGRPRSPLLRRSLHGILSTLLPGMLICSRSFIPITAMGVQTRTARLMPWIRSSAAKPIGWTRESRNDHLQTYQVTVTYDTSSCSNSTDEESVPLSFTTTTVSLPFIEQVGSLASSLWPAALAGAILVQSPAIQQQFARRKTPPPPTTTDEHPYQPRVVELGAGLGLLGRTLRESAAAPQVTCTDQDVAAIDLLRTPIRSPGTNMVEGKCGHAFDATQAMVLDWRDEELPDTLEPNSFDGVFGTDVAYYSFLVQPLLDTARALQRPSNSVFNVIGQANRQSLWDLLHTIRDGGYSQRTDQREPAWDGITTMNLYRLEMELWQDDSDESGNPATLDESISIAALLHTTSGLDLPALTDQDYVATARDEESIEKSF